MAVSEVNDGHNELELRMTSGFDPTQLLSL